VAFWDVSECTEPDQNTNLHSNGRANTFSIYKTELILADDLVNSLKEFVAYRTIAQNPAFVGDCHEAVTFLRKLFSLLHATTTILPIDYGINPILLAKFDASQNSQATKTVLFYGHYDVVDAEIGSGQETDQWLADPFQLHPLNGYLHGRGVTDNKGPILAALYAVADLVQSGSLSCNVVFLLEGEEEAGSRGFQRIVRQNRDRIGNVDYILLSNSYWLDDHIPCLTYGMRGVIHATVTVSSDEPDRHSGMDGKADKHEPLKDLTVLLSLLTGPSGTRIMIPGFYSGLEDRDKDELTRYANIAAALAPGHPEIKNQKAFAESLRQRWKEPHLTIHRIEVPESKTAVTISRFAKATLSIRTVPGQEGERVAKSLTSFIKSEFIKLGSNNKLEVNITSKADAWLGEPQNQIFQALESAITEVWYLQSDSRRSFPRPTPDSPQMKAPKRPQRRASSLVSTGNFTLENMPRKPLYIREGGSIPTISFLEKEFSAPAAMFPMGQASDNAHLSNERIRVENLYKGREVLKRVFSEL
jgi:di- and tripeptidase